MRVVLSFLPREATAAAEPPVLTSTTSTSDAPQNHPIRHEDPVTTACAGLVTYTSFTALPNPHSGGAIHHQSYFLFSPRKIVVRPGFPFNVKVVVRGEVSVVEDGSYNGGAGVGIGCSLGATLPRG